MAMTSDSQQFNSMMSALFEKAIMRVHDERPLFREICGRRPHGNWVPGGSRFGFDAAFSCDVSLGAVVPYSELSWGRSDHAIDMYAAAATDIARQLSSAIEDKWWAEVAPHSSPAPDFAWQTYDMYTIGPFPVPKEFAFPDARDVMVFISKFGEYPDAVIIAPNTSMFHGEFAFTTQSSAYVRPMSISFGARVSVDISARPIMATTRRWHDRLGFIPTRSGAR